MLFVINFVFVIGGFFFWFFGGIRCGEDDLKKFCFLFLFQFYNLRFFRGLQICKIVWFYLCRMRAMGRVGSITLFSCLGAWFLRCVSEFSFFSFRYVRGRFWRFSYVQEGKNVGLAFLYLFYYQQKGDDGFYFIYMQIYNKMLNFVRSYLNKLLFVFVVFLNLEILLFSEIVLLFCIFISVVLFVCYFFVFLFIFGGNFF